LRAALLHVLEQQAFLELLEEDERRAARQRSAGERRAVVAGLQRPRELRRDHAHAHRQPAAIGFASVTTSGFTPAASPARNVPVRPEPHWTSSWTSSVPFRRTACAPRACIRTDVAHAGFALDRLEEQRRGLLLASARERASTSPGRTQVQLGTRGSNGSRYFGLCVIESAPSERPWKPPSSATKLVRALAASCDDTVR